MPWQQLRLYSQQQQAEALSEQLSELGAVAVTLQDGADEPIFEPELNETPLWQQTQVVGLFNHDVDLTPILAAVQKEQTLEYQIEHIADQVWERAWMDHFHPIKFGNDLWICPSWQSPPDPEATVLYLDPGLAFGSGSHPTTALCLQWLASQFDCRDKQVIDYGCGSGILALAALKLGAKHVWAIDHDPQALLATERNAKRNDVNLARLSVSLPEDPPPPADLLIANILAEPLLTLYPLFTDLVQNNAKILLSGIIEKQLVSINSRYASAFNLDSPLQQEGWLCISGQKIT